MVVKVIVGLIPVFLFLIMLLYLDSFKLVSMQLLVICFVWGLTSAAMSYFLNTWLIGHFALRFEHYSGFYAPVVEETLKCSLLWMLIRRNKAGFMIDGAIYGFAIGATFSLAENLFYLSQYAGYGGSLVIWVTRGFGTAVMHSGTAAIFGMVCMSALNRRSGLWFASVAGVSAAILIHGIFNQFLFSPVVSTVVILLLVPASIAIIFSVSEKSIRSWLELEFDAETSILRMIKRGQFSETKAGTYLVSVREHFPREVVLDIYCFISLYLELSIKAKTMLMLHENGFEIPPDPGLQLKIRELKSLKKSIGRGGYLAIAPVLRMSRKDLWKLSQLERL